MTVGPTPIRRSQVTGPSGDFITCPLPRITYSEQSTQLDCVSGLVLLPGESLRLLPFSASPIPGHDVIHKTGST